MNHSPAPDYDPIAGFWMLVALVAIMAGILITLANGWAR